MFLDPDASKENLKIPQDTSQKKSRIPKHPKEAKNNIQYLTNFGQSLKQFWNRKTLTKMLKKEAQIQPFFCFSKFWILPITSNLTPLKPRFATQFGPTFLHKKQKRFTREPMISPRKPGETSKNLRSAFKKP
jgi:hypothetical protein